MPNNSIHPHHSDGDAVEDRTTQKRLVKRDEHNLSAPTRSFYFWLVKLSQTYGYCFATNGYLAQKQGRSESQIVRRIATLIAAGWLRREFVEGERRLFPVVIPSSKSSRRNSAPSKEREKVPLVLVPLPENAHPGQEKRAPPS